MVVGVGKVVVKAEGAAVVAGMVVEVLGVVPVGLWVDEGVG